MGSWAPSSPSCRSRPCSDPKPDKTWVIVLGPLIHDLVIGDNWTPSWVPLFSSWRHMCLPFGLPCWNSSQDWASSSSLPKSWINYTICLPRKPDSTYAHPSPSQGWVLVFCLPWVQPLLGSSLLFISPVLGAYYFLMLRLWKRKAPSGPSLWRGFSSLICPF